MKTFRLVALAMFLVPWLPGAGLAASSDKGGGAGSSGGSDPAERAWGEVKGLGRGRAAASNRVPDLLHEADRLQEFHTRYPAHPQAKNARGLEALALLEAWLAGDTSQNTRRERLVREIKADRSVSKELRAEVFALADHGAIVTRRDLTRGEKLRAHEQATRSLVNEFPELPVGYESLLGIARDSAEPRGSALAREVAGMPGAPEQVKREAQTVLKRGGLLGQSLPALAGPVAGGNHPLAAVGTQPVFAYAWASASPMSMLRAKALAARAPAGTRFVGVCLDRGDTAAARARAAAEQLPGEQIFDPAGPLGLLAQRLAFTEPGLIYAADAQGTIRSVTAHQHLDPAAALSGR